MTSTSTDEEGGKIDWARTFWGHIEHLNKFQVKVSHVYARSIAQTTFSVKLVAPNGTLRDTCVYSIIAAEWPTVKAHLEFQLTRS